MAAVTMDKDSAMQGVHPCCLICCAVEAFDLQTGSDQTGHLGRRVKRDGNQLDFDLNACTAAPPMQRRGVRGAGYGRIACGWVCRGSCLVGG